MRTDLRVRMGVPMPKGCECDGAHWVTAPFLESKSIRNSLRKQWKFGRFGCGNLHVSVVHFVRYRFLSRKNNILLQFIYVKQIGETSYNIILPN